MYVETKIDVAYLRFKEKTLINKIAEYIHNFKLDTGVEIKTIDILHDPETGIAKYIISYGLPKL